MSVTSSRVSLAVRAYESFNSRVQSLGVRVVPRRAWTEEADDGGFLSRTMPRVVHDSPKIVQRQSHAMTIDGSSSSSNMFDRSPPLSRSTNSSVRVEQHHQNNISPQTSTSGFPQSTLVVDLSKPPALFSFADDSSSEKGSERAGSEPTPNRPSSIYLDQQHQAKQYTCPVEANTSGGANLYPRYNVVAGSSPKPTSQEESSIISRDKSSVDPSSSSTRDKSTLSPQKSLGSSTGSSTTASLPSTTHSTDIQPVKATQVITPTTKNTKDPLETNLDEVISSSSSTNTGLVIISMTAEGQGRFGFNVKGGHDQGVPVIVSRVAGGTPADTCIPRLAEGDQVVMINGQDICQLTHDQVVGCIRAAARENKLVLAVKQVRVFFYNYNKTRV